MSVYGGDPKASSSGSSPSTPTVDLWYSSWRMYSLILLLSSPSSSGPPTRVAVEEEAGHTDLEIDAATLRRRCSRLSPRAAKASVVNLGVSSSALLCTGSS